MEEENELDSRWWNYRFIEKEYTSKTYKEIYYDIHEVFYNSKGEIVAWSTDPAPFCCENYKDFKIYLKQIKQASKKTILKYDTKDKNKLIDTHQVLKFRR